jgi:hypothetical protein
MSLFSWLRRQPVNGANVQIEQLEEWRRQWREATAAPDATAIASLSAQLAGLGLPEEEVEIEREMLDGLEQLTRLRTTLSATGLPLVETGHRVVGGEACHFSAPSSMPDGAVPASGRLFFTAARAVFAGGARAITLPWHTVADVVQQERDVILVRRDRETMHRFRCNLFGDALCAGLLARTLAARTRERRS